MKKIALLLILPLALLCSIFFNASSIYAAACTATTSGNWSTGSNWTGCTGAGGVPAVGDTITINTGITITLDTAATVAGTTIDGTLDTSGSNFAYTTGILTIDATGTFTANASTVTLNASAGTLFTNNGTFTAGTSTVIMASDAASTLTAGNLTFYNLTLAPTITTNRTYTFGAGTLAINNNFTTNPTASLSATLTVNMGAAATVGGMTLIQRTTSALSVISTTASNFAYTTAKMDIEAGGKFTANASTVTFTGTSGTILTNNSSNTNGFVVSGGSENFTGNGDITLTGGANTETLNSVNLTPTITANHVYTGGPGLTGSFASLTLNPNASSAFSLTVNLGVGYSTSLGINISRTGSATAILDTTGSNYPLTARNVAINAGGTLNANGSTITLTNTSTTNVDFTLSGSGTFNAGTSTVLINHDTSTTASSLLTSGTITFYNLTLAPTITANRNYLFGTGVLAVSNNFTINPTAASSVGLTVNLGANTTVTGTALIQGSSSASGTLNAYNGATTYTFTAGTLTVGTNGFYNPTTPACSATTSGSWSTGSNWTNCSGAGGIPSSSDNVTINSGVTITLDTAPTVATLTINGTLNTSSGSSFGLNATTLTIGATGTLVANGSTITLTTTTSPAFTNSGTFTSGTSTIVINGDAALTLTSGTFSFYNLTLSPTLTASRIYTFGASALAITNNLIINPTASSAFSLTVNLGAAATIGGTVTIQRTTSATSSLNTTSANNYAITMGKLDLEAGGTFTQNTSQGTFTGTSGTIITNNGGTFSTGAANQTFTGNGDITLTGGTSTETLNVIQLNPTLTANHTYTIGTGLAGLFSSITANPSAASAATLTIALSGALTMPNSLQLNATGSAAAVFDTTSSNYAFTAKAILLNTTGCGFKANASTVTLTGTTGNIIFTTTGATFTAGTSTVIINGDGAINTTVGTTLSLYNLTLSPTLTANRIYTLNNNSLTISNNFTINPTASSALTLTVNMGGAATVGGTTLIEGSSSAQSIFDTTSANHYAFSTNNFDLEAGGTFNAQSSALTVTGNWTNNGTFTQGTSTVTFNGANTATVLGATTFYNLSITPASAKEVDFSATGGDIIGVTNTFSAHGSSGNLVTLHSTSAGNQWHFNPTGTASADWISVKDGGCQVGSSNVSAADFTNEGNNGSCWVAVGSVPFGTVYYVDPNGSDSNTGTDVSHPWQTLTKVNGFTFQAGDEILFKAGGTWTGPLTTSTAGNSSHSIVYSSYGSGAKPIITGFKTLSGWSAVGGGVYQASCTACGSAVHMMTLDGVQQTIGRFPNADAANNGYLQYQSHSGTTSFTTNALDNSTDWTGAQVVMREQRWFINRYTITGQSGTAGNVTITHTDAGQTPIDNAQFFIQNDPATLDQLGEWYYNPSTQQVQVYFGGGGVGSHVVKVDTVASTVTINKSYVVIDGLSIQGSGTNGVNVASAGASTIQNSDILFSGTNGIQINTSNNFNVLNNTVNHANDIGIYIPYNGNSSSVTIKGNYVNDIGAMPAVMGTVDISNAIGIMTRDTNSGQPDDFEDIEQNEVDNVGNDAIFFGGNGTIINKNFINNCSLTRDDAGCIYTSNISTPSTTYSSIRQVTNNIIIGGVGIQDGTNSFFGTNGIYMDDYVHDVNISGNTVANLTRAGIFLHNNNRVTATNNLSYNNTKQQLEIQPNNAGVNIRNNTLTGNTFITPTSQTLANIITASNGDTMAQYGSSNNNYFVHPSAVTKPFATSGSNVPNQTLAQWQAATSQDLGSHDVIIPSTGTSQFFYNATNSPVNQALSGSYTNPAGTVFTSNISIPAYSSVFLMPTSAPSDTTPPTVSITAPTASAVVTGAAVSLAATASDNVAVSSVQFKIDGSSVGSADTVSPYTYTWDSSTVADGAHTVSATATDSSNNSTTSSTVSITVDNTAPVRSAGSPSSALPLNTTSTTLSLTTNESATCSYSTTAGTTYNAMTPFTTTGSTSHSATISGLTNGSNYIYYVRCRDTHNNTNINDYAISFSVTANSASPTVSITAPLNNAVVSGSSVSVTANAADDISVSGVQFKLDGSNLNAEDTGSPYVTTWNSTTATDGTHQLSAVARDGDGNITTSSTIFVTVDNTAPVRSGRSPSGSLTVDTTSTTLSLFTNEAATCKYSTTANVAYGSMANTFGTTGGVSHSTAISGLSNGSSYAYYVRCIDTHNNADTSDYVISFTIATAPNNPPIADAGSSQSITLPTSVFTLTGAGSDSDGTIASYGWTQISGTPVTITSPSSAVTTVTGITVADTYTFRLTVTDNNGTNDTADVTVTVNAATSSGGGGGGGGGGSSGGGGGGGGGAIVYLPDGCTNLTVYSATTGLPCNGSSLPVTTGVIPVGCTTTTAYSPLTGQQCPNYTGATSTGSSTTTTTGNSGTGGVLITKTLSLTMRDLEVITLQQYLNTHGYPVAPSGAGSVGHETSYFGPATKAAVKKFQAANGITPVSGIVATKTRAVLAQAGYSTIPSTTVTVPVVTTTPTKTTTTTSASSSSGTVALSENVIVIASNLNVHSAASLSSSSVGTVSYGTQGAVSKRNTANTMLYVSFDNGVKGWVSKTYVTVF